MKYILAILLTASSISAQELKPEEVMKLEKRNVEILSALTIQGKDSFLIGEVLQNCAKVHNDALLKLQEKQVLSEPPKDSLMPEDTK